MDQFSLNIQNICGHKSETMRCMWSKVGMGGEHHRYYKHTKFCLNPRGDPKFSCWFDTKWPIYNLIVSKSFTHYIGHLVTSTRKTMWLLGLLTNVVSGLLDMWSSYAALFTSLKHLLDSFNYKPRLLFKMTLI